jgi:hypothetical protein
VAHHVVLAFLDGQPVNSQGIPLVDDGQEHRIEITLGNEDK